MLVRETIHHGDYYNVREGEIAETYAAFVAFVQESPYATPVVRAENKYVREAYDALMSGKSGEFGWARYTEVF